jgi:hypothetical protein
MEDHVHNFPRSGNGCYCGAMQCEHEDTVVKPGRDAFNRPYTPVRKRCKGAIAAPSNHFCEAHQVTK